jgi:hypothetical protein
MTEIIIKSKIWKAGTNTLVLGISKRDVDLHNFKQGEVMVFKIMERYDYKKEYDKKADQLQKESNNKENKKKTIDIQ